MQCAFKIGHFQREAYFNLSKYSCRLLQPFVGFIKQNQEDLSDGSIITSCSKVKNN